LRRLDRDDTAERRPDNRVVEIALRERQRGFGDFERARGNV
jgi:hypothetical protein